MVVMTGDIIKTRKVFEDSQSHDVAWNELQTGCHITSPQEFMTRSQINNTS